LLLSGNVNLHEAATGRLLTTIEDGDSLISFSPDENSVLTVRYDAEKKLSHRQSYLSLRRIDSGQELSMFQVPEGIREIVWSPDGKTLAIVGLSFSPRVIDALSGRENGRLPYGNCWPWTMFGSDGCEPLRFSADGAIVLKEKEPLKLWDAKTVSLVAELKSAHLPASFSSTGVLATASADRKSVLLWRVKR
jgi:WD40 repeat protein